ncbi:MAG: addiction module protein [Pirellulales bacterium]|nr:addiction module protein [Pirellulales bacterium]
MNGQQLRARGSPASPADRAFIADALEQILPYEGFFTLEIAAAWASEVERRIEAFERGDIKAVDADTAIERMQQHLAALRASEAC